MMSYVIASFLVRVLEKVRSVSLSFSVLNHLPQTHMASTSPRTQYQVLASLPWDTKVIVLGDRITPENLPLDVSGLGVSMYCNSYRFNLRAFQQCEQALLSAESSLHAATGTGAGNEDPLALDSLRQTLGLEIVAGKRHDSLFKTRAAQHLMLYRLFDVSNRISETRSGLVPAHQRRPFELRTSGNFVSSWCFFEPSFLTVLV